MKYDPTSTTNGILSALLNVHNALSPENLTCDGELTEFQVRGRYRQLQRQKAELEGQLGFAPSEDELYEWHLDKRLYQRGQTAK